MQGTSLAARLKGYDTRHAFIQRLYHASFHKKLLGMENTGPHENGDAKRKKPIHINMLTIHQITKSSKAHIC